MRKKFKINRIASSDNYSLSRKVYRQYLENCHKANVEVIEQMTSSLVIKKQKYVAVFGKLVPVSEEELRIHNTTTLIIVEK